jgi:hypothetical protein
MFVQVSQFPVLNSIMDKFKPAQPVLSQEKVVIVSHPFKNFITFVFKLVLMVLLIFVVASISLYGEYIYLRTANFNLRVPGQLGIIYSQIDSLLGFEGEVLDFSN